MNRIRITTLMSTLALSALTFPTPSRGATWYARLYPQNRDFVEITVDTRTDETNRVFRRLVGHVQFVVLDGRSARQFAFVDALLPSVTGGRLLRRYFQHDFTEVEKAEPLLMEGLSGAGGEKADSAVESILPEDEPPSDGQPDVVGAVPGAGGQGVPPAPPDDAMHNGRFAMTHDGWRGTLVLSGSKGSYRAHDGKTFPVRVQAKGYYVVFYVIGLGGENADGTGGQKFEGYVMTQTRDAIAGTTWWDGRPFGFYATRSALVMPVRLINGTKLQQLELKKLQLNVPPKAK